MEEQLDHEAAPLVKGEEPASPSWTGQEYNRKRGISRTQLCLWMAILQVANVALFFLFGHSIVQRVMPTGTVRIDDYHGLFEFNRSWGMERPEFSDEAWQAMTGHPGVVSLTKERASKLGLGPSAPNPDSPGHVVYQVDVFHSLHCLVEIRKRMQDGADKPATLSHGHYMHCLNYILQALTCNVDLMLGNTDDDYKDYGLSGSHTCRDFNAVLRWVERYEWQGFYDWHAAHDKRNVINQ